MFLGRLISASYLLSLFLVFGCATTDEHAGDKASEEHAGDEAKDGKKKEHAGDKAKNGKKKEHAGKKMKKKKKKKKSASNMNKKIYASDIKKAMKAHIAEMQVKGIYSIDDVKTSEALELGFIKIHDPVREIKGRGYFACTDFRPKGAVASKLYDLDFWLNVNDEGVLKVTEVAIHKHPEVQKTGKWKKVARYTFVNDVPVEVK